MINEELKKKIDTIIISDVGIDPISIDTDQSIREQVSLDSMQFIGLVAKLENELQVELPFAIMQVNTLNEFYDAIIKQLEKVARR